MQTICGIGFLITPFYSHHAECRLYTTEYGKEFADSNYFQCRSLAERISFVFGRIDTAVFSGIFAAPALAGITEIIYSLKRSRVVSSSRYFVILAFLSIYAGIAFFLWFGFMDNSSYLSKCPLNAEGNADNCSILIQNYNLKQSEYLMMSIFTVIGVFSTALFLIKTHERIGRHETVKE
jgi:hypothetical protein